VIGKRLRLARVNAGLTQAELGVRAGLDEETASSRISSYENEIHSPDFGLVKRLAEVLDTPVPYFYTEDDDLASLIQQYHRYKKQQPNAIIVISPE